MKRRSFFLLEVLIAVAIVGSFAYFSIHGAFQTLAKERKMLKEFTDSMKADNKRMGIIVKYWSTAETLKETVDEGNGYKVSSQDAKDRKHYLLKIEGPGKDKPFYYLVTKS